MKSLKSKLISTVRNHCIEQKGRPTIVVHHALAIQHGGEFSTFQPDSKGFVVFRIGPNAVRNYTEQNDDILFDVTLKGEVKRILIPTIAVVACLNADHTDDGIEFNLIMDVAKFNKEFSDAASTANQIMSKYFHNDEQRKE